jgi:tRNA (mo5U34)-methyltransferase
METAPYTALRAHCRSLSIDGRWTEQACALSNDRLAQCRHGDLPRWREALDRLPTAKPVAALDQPAPRLGRAADASAELPENLMALHPWRKGPFEIAGIRIETEWRSDLKWDRIAPHIELRGHRILDVGCGNGYFGWRMLAAGADLVIGVDPTWVFVMQWLACRHFAGDLPNFVLPLGIEDLPEVQMAFDSVFSMGVLYHRKNPVDHLRRLGGLLRSGGTLVLETLVLPDEASQGLLEPADRYARMRNVWAIPGCGRLADWVHEAGFLDARLVDVGATTAEEQRSTNWMKFESLEKALNPDNPSLTVEGHPAPRRAVLIARAGL